MFLKKFAFFTTLFYVVARRKQKTHGEEGGQDERDKKIRLTGKERNGFPPKRM